MNTIYKNEKYMNTISRCCVQMLLLDIAPITKTNMVLS